VKSVQETGDGKLKYLINNAGLGLISPILDVDVEKAKQIWEVNYWGVIRMTKAFSSLVIESKGTIVTMGSGAGVVSFPWSFTCPLYTP
jgi:1-acylglycerone phosphate reductase